MTKTKTITRPWQGTLLAILSIIGLIFTSLFIILFLLLSIGGGMLAFVNNINPGLATLIGGGGLIATFLFVLLFILGIFIIKGIFKGQKWAIIITLIFSALNLLGLIRNFNILSILIIGAIIYLEITCLLHPFYNKK